MKKTVRILTVLALSIVCLGFVVNVRYAFADPSSVDNATNAIKKTLAYGVYNCYVNGKVEKEVNISHVLAPGDLVNKQDGIVRMYGPLFDGKMNAKISCKDFFGGKKVTHVKWGKVAGHVALNVLFPVGGSIISMYTVATKGWDAWSENDGWKGIIGTDDFTTLEKKKTLLEDMGYEEKTRAKKVTLKFDHISHLGGTVQNYEVGDILIGDERADDVSLTKNTSYNKDYVKVNLKNSSSGKKLVVQLTGSAGPNTAPLTIDQTVEIDIIGAMQWVDESHDYGDTIAKAICDSEAMKSLYKFKCSYSAGKVESISFAVDVNVEVPDSKIEDSGSYYTGEGCASDDYCQTVYYNLVKIDGSALREQVFSEKWGLKTADNGAAGAFTFVTKRLDFPVQYVSAFALNNYERVWLYDEIYLKHYYGADKKCEGEFNIESVTDIENSVKVIKDKDERVCAVYCNQNCSEKVNGLDKMGYFNTELGFSEIAEGADVSNIPNYDPEKYKEVEEENKIPAVVTDGESNCYEGAKSLGWIICPTMAFLGDQTKNIYENMIEPLLNVNSKLFSNDKGGDTRQAWLIFQNIANILFVVLLLFIIFSQLTGYGIDNYGIKKILPKLVVAVVLINLSYVICELAVDLSNIMGSGFKSFFDGINLDISELHIAESGMDNQSLEGVFATGISAVGIAGIFTSMVAAVYVNPAIILPVLISLIGVFIGVIFFFIILAARQVAIVCYVVISPLAFACMMLPNTKRFFDKWWKVGWGLLLVYPICGLLIGGGNFVSKLFLSVNMDKGAVSFFEAFVAMAASIAPIFFIPEVVSNAMNALPNVLGGLANKISGLGKNVSRGTQGAIRGSEAYKNAQRMGLERRTRIKAGLDRNNQATKFGERKDKLAKSRFGKLIGADRRQAAYIAAAKKNFSAAEEADAQLTKVLAKSGIADVAAKMQGGNWAQLSDVDGDLKAFNGSPEGGYYMQQLFDAIKSKNVTNTNAAFAAMKNSNMKQKDIARGLRYAINSGMFNGWDKNVMSDFLFDLSKKEGNGFLATDYELKRFAQNGGLVSGGTNAGARATLGAYGSFAQNPDNGIKLEDLDPENDIGKLSKESIAALAMENKINPGTAKTAVINNPNLTADKKVMLHAIENGYVVNSVQQFKDDVDKILAGATGVFGGVNITAEMAKAWMSSAPQEVNVVQDPNYGDPSVELQKTPLKGELVNGQGQTFVVQPQGGKRGRKNRNP